MMLGVEPDLEVIGDAADGAEAVEMCRRLSRRVTDEQAVSAFRETCRLEGIIPALECSHAIAWLFADGADGSPGYDLLTLSGRGDKDLAEVLGLDE